MDYDYLFKLVVIGDSGVGKTALLRRLVDNRFIPEHMTTIGVDLDVITRETSNGKVVKLQIWDTAGQERFQTITSSYYRGTHAVMIVCDVTNLESMQNIVLRYNEFRKHNKTCENILIVGNKIDRKQMRQVSFQDLEDLSNQLRLELKPVETSALVDKGSINEAIDYLIENVCTSAQFTQRQNETRIANSSIGIDISQTCKTKFSCCMLS